MKTTLCGHADLKSLSVYLSLFAGMAIVTLAHADEPPKYDLSKDKVLYCVGYAHLDTQWRWDFCTTIDKYVRDTLEQNFALFEKYPEYVFNFTGSVRYEMMKEYYPEHYEKLKKYIADGRWFVSGSSVDEGDVNVPSAESIIRQVLYGNEYFRREFGKESVDFMLPDCFGFPASMPSIWAHCGLKGFSTQKLTWGSAVGIPFKIGVWEGLDGNGIIAAFDPGSYSTAIKGPVQTNEGWIKRIEENGQKYGVFADYHYYGVGDQGGAPLEEDVANYIASMKAENAPIRLALTSSDQMYKDITAEQRAKLPRYKGDLLLTEHSAGTLTSQSYMKRWNRKNEILADAAERAAVAAHWLGAAEYPREQLNKSWVRALANQMHDILPGTSIPRAYTYSWNDEIVAMNGFADVLLNSVGAVSRGLDTNVEGVPLIVYNPLAIEREDVVEARVEFPEGAPKAVRVFNPKGNEIPSQIKARDDKSVAVLFTANVDSVSFSAFEIRKSDTPYATKSDSPLIRISNSQIENEHLCITIDDNGDVGSIKKAPAELDYSKLPGGIAGRPEGFMSEILSAPHGLVFTYERPSNWPAWNMDWADRKEAPIDRVKGPAKVRVVEDGPVRVALEIEREANNSIITQQIRLAAGSKRVEFHTTIDWQSTECALKASFPLKASNPKATYNWGMGTIERGNNEPTKYEVPSHEWIDLTDASGKFGVSILDDSKYGSDKPSDNELRLTLLYTPGVRSSYKDQQSQDWGRHEIVYAIYPHQNDWRGPKLKEVEALTKRLTSSGMTEWEARRLNQPLYVFQSPKHDGELGRSWSMINMNTNRVDIRAIKMAEREDAVVVRLQELTGQPIENALVRFELPTAGAYEADGQERRIGDANLAIDKLSVNIAPYTPKTFVVKPGKPPVTLAPPKSEPIKLAFDCDIVSTDKNRSNGAMASTLKPITDKGPLLRVTNPYSIPAEELPKNLNNASVGFTLGDTFGSDQDLTGAKNAVTCDGQKLQLPEGSEGRLYLLATATEDVREKLEIGNTKFPFNVQKWTDFIGQFDDRVWDKQFDEVDHVCDGKVTSIKTGYIKRDPIAWFCTHRHHPERNEPYQFSYIFRYGFDIPKGAKSFTLPKNDKIKVFAASVAKNANDTLRPAAPLYDDFTDRKPIEFRHVYPPPLPPVHEGLTPTAQVKSERVSKYEELTLATPSNADFVDRATNATRAFRVFDGRGKYRPHGRSGAENGTLPRLNDGQVQGKQDDPNMSTWYDGAGRFSVDLGSPVAIDKINTFSWHRSDRAPQVFTLWASASETAPPMDFLEGGKSEWKLIAIVNTKELGEGGVHVSSISASEGKLGPYRHLLWITEEVAQGTFFGEIDVVVAP